MNTKTLLALAALTVVGTASAVVTSANTLCRIEVNSGTKSTIIAVPLVKVGDGSGIPANQLVLTDNLADGDTILHWNADDGKWDAWVIDNGAWTPTATAAGNNVNTTAPVADTPLARGEAIWVNRNSATADLTKPFFIYGQVATGDGTLPAIPARTSEPVYTMMGNNSLTAVAVNALPLNGTPATGDMIVWGSKTTREGVNRFTYDASKAEGSRWGYDKLETVTLNGKTVSKTTWTAADVALEPGQGFWYISK